MEITKTYSLKPVEKAQAANQDYKAYHLQLVIGIRNVGGSERQVAYQLDGPTGLPTEGYWYQTIGAGNRDVAVAFGSEKIDRVASTKIGQGGQPDLDRSVAAVDRRCCQYFASVLLPPPEDPQHPLIDKSQAIRVGQVDRTFPATVDTSCRVVSHLTTLKAHGGSLEHRYLIFAGPKRPKLLEPYEMAELIDYGMFSFIAKPLVKVLDFFYAGVHNYGIAIILLVALVRLCMFPLSRKQAIGAQKMQQIQPELKRLQEKYKKDAEGMRKAQQELFRKHNYNPLGGCLPLFIQMPIFFALYRTLAVNVELRQAPLLTESIRWCSNLAAPDMLFNWSSFMPEFVNAGASMFSPGPYLNILPIVTVIIYLWQQMVMMPPATDENAATQQKIMKYMMVFMGLMFYRVASGLCLYFIVSSLWGVGERKFLPKLQHHASDEGSRPPRGNGGDSSGRAKKPRRR